MKVQITSIPKSRTGPQSAVFQMWTRLAKMARNNKGRAVFVSLEELQSWRTDIAMSCIRRAARRLDFKVRTQFGDGGIYIWFVRKENRQ